MNKLRIILNEDGSVSQFTPDFKIMRGSYRNVLINLEVPHALLLDPATDTDDGTGTTGNNVRIGAIITTATGKHIQTQRYEFQRVKDFTREGTTYRLYQRRMPKEFTMWETVSSTEDTESGQVTLVINVVNWTTNSLGAQIEEVAASPKFTLDIYPSAFLDEAEEIAEPSDFDELQSQVQNLSADFTTVKTDLYSESSEGLGEYLTSRLAEGNKIVLTNTGAQVEIAVDTLYASDITMSSEDEGEEAEDLQAAFDALKTQVENNKSNITSLTEGVDLAAMQAQVEENESAISQEASDRKTADSALQTEVDSLKEGSGASLALTLDEDYILTIDLKNSEGTVLSTKSVDLPLESMIVDGSYADGKLTLTLQNGTQLEPIDISDLISGLVSQDDFDALETELATSVVHTSGDEDISGTKNFTGVFQIGGATVTYDAETDTFVF